MRSFWDIVGILMGTRYSREELRHIDALVEEGVTSREIAECLGRSEAGIRNLRYRKGLISRVEDETKTLFQRRDELQSSVDEPETRQEKLLRETEMLEEKKQIIEQYLQLDRSTLQYVLEQVLITLKEEKPGLFVLSGPEQVGLLVRFILYVFK